MKTYICEIKDIARANKAGSFSDACDMFLANVNNTANPKAQYHYAGAEMVNYAGLYRRLDALRESKAALVAFHQKNIGKINEMYQAGQRAELRRWAAEVLG